ncbi:hypothetical protein NHF48_019875 [Sphingomonas sp. H160509]|uniref:hypothetical protein n=1 Tax=Sphingomonas sp. H160509 TaxID=2955313 RepID=UPI0021E7B9C9|nr:hypothetical protein [Sphingomonas sp. H160509]MDD1452678.1 hypothetical protein [Sphingomonas sp. H160509]
MGVASFAPPGAPEMAEPIGGLAEEFERLNETFPDEPQTPGMAEFMAKAHQEAFGTPAPAPSADLSDMMAAIERVTGQKGKLC